MSRPRSPLRASWRPKTLRRNKRFNDSPRTLNLTGATLRTIVVIDPRAALPLVEVPRFMSPGRLEAFSDGVLAIIITIMVLDLRVPHGDTLAALYPLGAAFLAYVL